MPLRATAGRSSLPHLRWACSHAPRSGRRTSSVQSSRAGHACACKFRVLSQQQAERRPGLVRFAGLNLHHRPAATPHFTSCPDDVCAAVQLLLSVTWRACRQASKTVACGACFAFPKDDPYLWERKRKAIDPVYYFKNYTMKQCFDY